MLIVGGTFWIFSRQFYSLSICLINFGYFILRNTFDTLEQGCTTQIQWQAKRNVIRIFAGQSVYVCNNFQRVSLKKQANYT